MDTSAPGGYFVGRPLRQSVEGDLPGDMDATAPGDYFIGRPGYFIGRPRPLRESVEGDAVPDEFLRLALSKLTAVVHGDTAAATMPLQLRDDFKEMNRIMMGLPRGVDRSLLKTACHEIIDMVDKLQANNGASLVQISGIMTKDGPCVPKIPMAEKMKNIRDVLEKIDWQLYKHVVPAPLLDRAQSTSSHKDGARQNPELPHQILKRTDRIFVDLERLVDLLLSLSIANSSRQSVILPIVGLGGIGKTTLAKLVYSHEKFKDYSKHWVSNPKDGLFLEQLHHGGNKLMVVLDDLQDKTCSGPSNFKQDLINNVGKNAIVIVTTRSEGAAKKICNMDVEPYKLPADMHFVTIKPTEVPAAGDTDSTLCCVLESLKESYDLMPPNLMSCFAYCGILPEGCSIVKDDIIHQWIALDLIDRSDNSFQLGEEYIRMLLDISFLQPAMQLASTSEKEHNGGTLFTMHDVVHALARSVVGIDGIILDGRNGKPSEKKHCKYALLTNFDIAPVMLSKLLTKDVTALLLLGCSKMELSDDSFSFAKGLHVLNIREPSMSKLPGSICQLRQLTYLNLSGCSGLIKLPESFGMLKKLEYLDLSFCACLEGIPSALGSLTNLQHLNLSHPCSYLAEHRFHLKELEGIWIKLIKLQYLNLSMCLNPIICYLEVKEANEYIESISNILSLKHLDLSHNIFLSELPERLGGLSHLHTLDLSGCIRLKRIDKWLSEMVSLKFLLLRNCRGLETYQFVVPADATAYCRGKLVQLEDVVSCKGLEISCLENLKSMVEAKRIGLDKKQKLEKLTLGWTMGSHGSSVDNEALIAELMPPQNLQHFEIHGYTAKRFPAWLTTSICSHLPNLVKVIMEDIPSCSTLPPLLLLPNLQVVVLRRMAGITRIDAGELSGSNGAECKQLLLFTLDDLEDLEEFNIIYNSGDKEFMFPAIYELVIQKCSKLMFRPFPPTAQVFMILDNCDQVMSSLPKREVQGLDASSSSTSSSSVLETQLVVDKCKVPLDDWTLLHYLPNLCSLEMRNSSYMTRSPEIIQILSSIQKLCFSKCESMTSLPGYFGSLTSLRELAIDECNGITSLPESIDKLINLKVLHIKGCPSLKMWCESDENKQKLAHIQKIYKEPNDV